ncbi:hypothetical protein BDQ17DRAFT_1347679, partial [Cyathus striatus]
MDTSSANKDHPNQDTESEVLEKVETTGNQDNRNQNTESKVAGKGDITPASSVNPVAAGKKLDPLKDY